MFSEFSDKTGLKHQGYSSSFSGNRYFSTTNQGSTKEEKNYKKLRIYFSNTNKISIMLFTYIPAYYKVGDSPTLHINPLSFFGGFLVG